MSDPWASAQVGRRFWAGAPLRREDQKRYVDVLVSALGLNEAHGNIRETMNQVTDKSVGILQAVSIFAAVAIFLADGQPHSLGAIALLLLFAAALVLIFNLGFSWRAYNEEFIRSKALCLIMLRIAVGRIFRFQLSLLLTLLAVALTFIQIVVDQ